MLQELITEELAIYKVKKREVKEGDETALFKSLRDRQKLRNWLRALLKENDVILFYIDEDDGLEKYVVATTQGYDENVFDIPTVTETFRDNSYETFHHLAFVSVPDYTPYYIHVDDITQFILKNSKVTEISNKTKLW